MKFNWGHGITLFYVVFVCVLATVLVKSFSVDHSLVVDDYYAQDLRYQQRYDKKANAIHAGANKVDVALDSETKMLSIDINADKLSQGQVQLYRPSDKSQDFVKQLDSNLTQISTKDMMKGRWILKMEWKDLNKEYYTEQSIYIQ